MSLLHKIKITIRRKGSVYCFVVTFRPMNFDKLLLKTILMRSSVIIMYLGNGTGERFIKDTKKLNAGTDFVCMLPFTRVAVDGPLK